MKLNRVSLIVGIVGTVFVSAWSVWTHLHPAETVPPSQGLEIAVEGRQNIVIHGNNNSVSAQSGLSHFSQSVAPNPELVVGQLTTGMRREAFEAQIGAPTFEDVFADWGARNLIYVFPRFFLQAIASPEGKIIFYSLTTRAADFRPSIPYLQGGLLDSTFADFGGAEHVYGRTTSKYYEYAERIYIGNRGNYRNIYLGYCPAGVYPGMANLAPVVLDRDGAEALAHFRETNSPNCFGVGEILGDESRLLENTPMGIDYYIARDL